MSEEAKPVEAKKEAAKKPRAKKAEPKKVRVWKHTMVIKGEGVCEKGSIVTADQEKAFEAQVLKGFDQKKGGERPSIDNHITEISA
jgi:hypothetical protein